MVAFIDALRLYDSRVISCSLAPMRRAGMTNTGSITTEMRVICHDRLNMTPAVSSQSDDVGHETGQGGGECLLRPQHVVVQTADQCAGLGTGEERERHALDVIEHRRAHVEDQALADAGGVPTLGEGQDRVDDRQPGDHECDLHDHAGPDRDW